MGLWAMLSLGGEQALEKHASILPNSMEAYKYIARITYRETVFERDLSAVEVYVQKYAKNQRS